MRRTIVLVVSVGVAVIAFVLLYLRWVSLGYSLRQITDAIADRDANKFQKYVDVDQLSAQAVDNLASNADGLAFAVAQNMRPTLIARFKTALLEGVEAGDLRTRTFAGLPGNIRPLRIGTTTRHGKVADVELITTCPPHPDEITLKLQLRDKGSYWQLFRIANFGDTVSLISVLNTRVAAAALDRQIRAAQAEQAARIAQLPPPVIVTSTPSATTPTTTEPAIEYRTVNRVIGYRTRSIQLPGDVVFDRANRDFHIVGCPAITSEMEHTSFRAMQVQSIPRNRDCMNRPLPYETRTIQEPITETVRESVPRQP